MTDLEESGVIPVTDLLDAAQVSLPTDSDEYPPVLRLVLSELFGGLRHAANLRRNGEPREAAIQALRAAAVFLARFDGANRDGLIASFTSLDSALMALDNGIREPLLRHKPKRGRGENSMEREHAIAAAVGTVHHLTWTGMKLDQAHKLVAGVIQKAGFHRARHGRGVEARTVRGWCEAVAQDVGRHTQRAQLVDVFLDEKYRKEFSAMPPGDARKRILETFQTILIRFSGILENPANRKPS